MDGNEHITDPTLRRYLGLAPQTFYNHQDGGWYRVSNDGYNPDQPRDDNGRWTTEGKNKKYIANLPASEYNHIVHELNNNLTNEEFRRGYVTKYIGNFAYEVKIKEFNEYDIIDKWSIDNVYD